MHTSETFSRRRRLRALVAIVAGSVAAALSVSSAAQAATDYSCIGAGVPGTPSAGNIASGVELSVAFTGDFPRVAVGEPFAIQPTVQYKLDNGYLHQLVDAGVLADTTADDATPTEHKLGGMTFWVTVAGANTVEQRQQMRATVNASANTRVLVQAEAGATEVWIQRYTAAGAPTGSPIQDLAGTASLNSTGIGWTPASTAPVSFSVAPAGTLGAVQVQQQWRRNNDFAAAPLDTVIDGAPGAGVPDVDPLTSARAYGNVYLRLRLGGNEPSNGRTSLDCLAGSVALLDSAIAYSEAGNRPPAEGGDRGRYTLLPASPVPFASVTPEALAQRFQCIDGLGRYRQREINTYSLAVNTTVAPGAFTPGAPYTLKGTKIGAEIDPGMLKALYATLLNYEELPPGGELDQPISLWLAVQGSNTAEGIQIVKVESRWQARFVDPDGVLGSGDETFPAVKLDFDVPDTTWTPTGGEPIAFSVAAPAQIPELTLIGRGHSGDAGAVFPMWPYGSLFIRAETGRYGASIDCLEGSIRYADLSVPFSNLGRRSPELLIPEPVPAGGPPNGDTVPAGSAGRYAITHNAGDAFATVPAVQAAVVPVPPVAQPTVAARPSVRSTKLTVKNGKLAVRVACPATSAAPCAGTVRVRTAGKHRLKSGGKRKLVTLTASKRYTLAPGKSASVSLKLGKNAKRLLARRKSTKLKVRVLVAQGGATVTRAITLQG